MSCNYNIKNNRTLKNRIRKILSLCLFLTILLLSLGFSSIMAFMLKHQLSVMTTDISTTTANFIKSPEFLKAMKINKLEDFNSKTDEANFFKESLENEHSTNKIMKLLPQQLELIKKNRHNNIYERIEELPPPTINNFQEYVDNYLFNQDNMVYLDILINDSFSFSNKSEMSGYVQNDIKLQSQKLPFIIKPIINNLLTSFISINNNENLYSSNGKVIGFVHTGVNADYIVSLIIAFLIIILILSALSLLIGNLIGKLLTIPITVPLKQLSEKLNDMADEDFEKVLNSSINIKKPLKEIEILIFAANRIMFKMKNYSDNLNSQKQLLENSNEELEAQNEELIESKNLIENQQKELELKNDELEAQNEELFESKKKIEDAQTLLIQSENLASVGQLTAAITHEINTPLGAINSNSQLLEVLLSLLESNLLSIDNAEISELLNQLKETNSISLMACERVTEIIKSLKSFARVDQAEFQEADINESIKSVLVLSSNLWKRKIEIHQELASDLPKIKCFPGMLNQVFMNILVNAIQAIPEKGNIHIKSFYNQESIFISIKDDGSGITDDNLTKIFEYGFSTKKSGSGMGIGLSICKNVILKHKGIIDIKSKLDEGTEFTIRLPIN